MKNKIWLSSPHMEGHEIEYVIEAYNKNHVFPLGDYVNLFENKILNTLDASHKFCTALNSGTSSIHLALKLCNIEQGDDVICSNFTFSASVNPILYEGANPIFIDSENETWNMCPILLEECILDRIKLGKKPKAIILVHLYGMPAKLQEIIKIATTYNIPVIEDAAEALGSMYKNKSIGVIGDYGIFSFNGNKIITTSAGGALISNTAESKTLALKYATQSREAELWYEHTQVGYNYRLSNIAAAIGVGQIEVLEKRVKRRREIFHTYVENFSDVDNISFQMEPNSDYFSNHWLSTCKFLDGKNPLSLINFLDQNNIESRPLWKPMHMQPVFCNYKSYLNGVSENLFQNGICLPSSSLLSINDQQFIIKKIKEWYLSQH
jgi:dTDP-4-amino-4,6-dideoxygalactose transaminase